MKMSTHELTLFNHSIKSRRLVITTYTVQTHNVSFVTGFLSFYQARVLYLLDYVTPTDFFFRSGLMDLTSLNLRKFPILILKCSQFRLHCTCICVAVVCGPQNHFAINQVNCVFWKYNKSNRPRFKELYFLLARKKNSTVQF